jgi:hypothetical protein
MDYKGIDYIYNYNTDYPEGDEEFIGLYADPANGFRHTLHRIIRRSKEPLHPFRFITEHGGAPHFIGDPIAWARAPHFIGDPIAWAPLPKTKPGARPPVEHHVAKMDGSLQIPADMLHRVELQKREFDTLDLVVAALKALPAIVDDDYPRYRHYYDRALDAFLRAAYDNGRFRHIAKGPGKLSQTELEACGYRGE